MKKAILSTLCLLAISSTSYAADEACAILIKPNKQGAVDPRLVDQLTKNGFTPSEKEDAAFQFRYTMIEKIYSESQGQVIVSMVGLLQPGQSILIPTELEYKLTQNSSEVFTAAYEVNKEIKASSQENGKYEVRYSGIDDVIERVNQDLPNCKNGLIERK